MAASKRSRRFNYAVNNKRVKNDSKVQQAQKHHEKLQQRIGFEWETKWLLNAMEFSSKKLRKYWIKTN